MPRIGVIWPAAPATAEPLRQALRDLGYAEGQNVVTEWRFTEGRRDVLPDEVARLVALPVDVLVAGGPPVVRAASQGTSSVPIVAHDLETDPVAAGLVASIARPGGNLTGLFLNVAEMAGKQVELLREAVPGATRIAALWDPDTAPYPRRAAEEAAKLLGVELAILEVTAAEALDAAFLTADQQGATALIVLSSPLFYLHLARIAELANRYRLPSITLFREYADSGGLMAYGPSLPDSFRRLAYYVDRILKGAQPGALPIERPSRFELVVNMKTARALGVAFPQSILLQVTDAIY